MFLSHLQPSKKKKRLLAIPSLGAHCFLPALPLSEHVVKNIIRKRECVQGDFVCVCDWRRPAVPLLPSICRALTCPSRRRQPHVALLTLTCLTPLCLAPNKIAKKATPEIEMIEMCHRAAKTSHSPGTVGDAQLPKRDLIGAGVEACLIARTHSH